MPTINENNGHIEKRKDVPLEAALDLTGFGKYNILICVVSSLSLLATALDFMSMSIVVPSASCDLNLIMEQKGFLTSVSMMGLVVMCYPWGYISDTKGRRFSLMWSMALGFVFAVAASFSANMITIAILKFLAGACSSAANSVTYTMCGEFQPRKYRDRMLYYMTTSLMSAGALVSIIAIPILGVVQFRYPIDFLGIIFSPWRLQLIIVASPLLIVTILLLFTDETPKYLLIHGKSEEALKVLRKIYRYNTGNSGETYPVDSITIDDKDVLYVPESFCKSLWTQFSPLFKKPLLKYSALIFYIQFGTYFVTNMLFLWIPTTTLMYLDGLAMGVPSGDGMCGVISSSLKNTTQPQDNLECTDYVRIEVPVTMIVASMLSTVINVILASIIKFTGKKYLLVGANVVCGLASLFVAVFTDPWVGFAMNMITMQISVIMAVTISYVVDLYPTSVRGMAVCIAVMIGRIGGNIGANVYGVLIEDYCNELYYLNTFMLISSALVAFLLPADNVEKEVNDQKA